MLENIAKTGEQIGKLRGSISTLTKKRDIAQEDLNNEAALTKQAQSKGIQTQIILHSNQVARLEKMINTYNALLQKLIGLKDVLQKIYENTQVIYQDTKNDIDMKEAEWDSIKQANSAMKSALSAINGDPDQRAIYEQALGYMQDDLGLKIGEMEQFLLDTSNIMQTIDLQTDANVDRGLAIVSKLEHNADTMLNKFIQPIQIEHKPIINADFSVINSQDPVKVTENKPANKNSKIFEDIYKS